MAKIEPLQVVHIDNADLQTTVGGEDEFIPLPSSGSMDVAQQEKVDVQAIGVRDEFAAEEIGVGSDDPTAGNYMEPRRSDVVKFETVFLTNKYEVPLASFIGVNHHGQSILLGCGLLSNQNTESFAWLFIFN